MASTAAISYQGSQFSSGHSMFPLAASPNPMRACIGANYSASFTYLLSGKHADGSAFTLAGAEIFVDFARFIPNGQYWYPSGTVPRTGWYVKLPAVVAVGTYAMVPVNFGQTEDTLANATVQLSVTNSTTYSIAIKDDFFLADFDEYHRQHSVDHNKILLLSSLRAPRTEDNSYLASVYRTERALGVIQEVLHLGNKVRFENHQPIRLRYWNVDESNVESSFSFEVELTRSSAPVDEFSSYQGTMVNLYISKPGGLKLVDVVAMIWEESENNENSWISDLRYSHFKLANDLAGSSQKDGMIYAPTKALTYNASLGRYEAYFRVPSGSVTPGKRYRIAAYSTVQTDPGSVYRNVQSWLSPIRYTANSIPGPYMLDVETTVYDPDSTALANLVENATPADRYGVEILVDKAAYDADFDAGSFEEDLHSVSLKIYEFATPGTLLANYTLVRTGGVFPTNNKAISVNEGASTFAVGTELRAQFLNSQGILDLAGKDLIIEFGLRFDYDGPPSHSYVYLYKARIKFRQYDNVLTLPSRKIEGIYYYDADTGLPISSMCNVSRILVEVVLESGHGSTGNNFHFRGMIDRTPYGSTFWNDLGLEEFDGYVPAHLPQLQELPIESADEYFDTDGVARMIVDVSGIPTGEERRIIAIKGVSV